LNTRRNIRIQRLKHTPGGQEHDQSTHAWNRGEGSASALSPTSQLQPQSRANSNKGIISNLNRFIAKMIGGNVSLRKQAAQKFLNNLLFSPGAIKLNPSETRLLMEQCRGEIANHVNNIVFYKNQQKQSGAANPQYDMAISNSMREIAKQVNTMTRATINIANAYSKTFKFKNELANELAGEYKKISEMQKKLQSLTIGTPEYDTLDKQLQLRMSVHNFITNELNKSNTAEEMEFSMYQHILSSLRNKLNDNVVVPVPVIHHDPQNPFDTMGLKDAEMIQLAQDTLAMYSNTQGLSFSIEKSGGRSEIYSIPDPVTNTVHSDILVEVDTETFNIPHESIHAALMINSLVPLMLQKWGEMVTDGEQPQPLNVLTNTNQFASTEFAFKDAIIRPDRYYTLKIDAKGMFEEINTMAFTMLWEGGDDLIRPLRASLLAMTMTQDISRHQYTNMKNVAYFSQLIEIYDEIIRSQKIFH